MNYTKNKEAKALEKIVSVGVVFIIFASFIAVSVNAIGLELDFTTLIQYKSRLWQGFIMTLVISVGSLILSLLIGTITALGQSSRLLVFNYICKVYVQIIRGTPLLVQIYFFYYIIGTAWGIDNRYVAGIIILSIFEGAYVSEIIRGGLQSIDSQQYEIAKAIGLDRVKTFKLVTFPILMARILPALTGQFTAIIKDSSLLSVIAVIELTQTIQEISADNFRMFENYIFVGFLYFMLTFVISILSKVIERRYNYED